MQGRSPYAGTNAYRTIKWVHSFGNDADGDIQSAAVIGSDGTIYFGTQGANKNFYALNPSDGSVKWSYPIGGNIYGTAAVDTNGIIYYGADKFYALNPDGTLKCSYTGGSYLLSHPNIDTDGTIFTEVYTTHIYARAFNPDCTVKYTSTQYPGNGSGLGHAPIAFDNTYLYLTGDSKTIALNKADGNLAWQRADIKYWVGHVVIGDDGRIYLAYADNAWALNSSDGSTYWHNTLATGGDWSYVSLNYDGKLLAGTNTAPKRVIVFDALGNTSWTYNLLSYEGIYWFTVTSDHQGNLYVTAESTGATKRTFILDSSGNFKWSYSASNIFASAVTTIADGTMYLGNNNYKFYAWTPWTLSGSANTTYYKTGNTLTITATTSMLQTDPTSAENNQVQVVMANGDKVTLSYVSASGGNTTWSGNYTVPSGITDGSYSGTVEAASVNVQTDVTTHFASTPTGSSNTGINSTFSYTIDNTGPTSTDLISPKDYTKDNTKPTLSFKKATDTSSGISSYTVKLDDGKSQSYSTSSIPTSGNGSASYVWKDDSNVKVEFLNENDSDSTSDEIHVYFKDLNNNELTEGKHSWSVTAYDSLGNSTTSSTDFYIDKTLPSVSELAITNVSTVTSGKAYQINITNRTPSFSGKAIDTYQGSTKTNSNGTKDTFDKASSGPDKITLTLKKLKTGENPNSQSAIYVDYLVRSIPCKEYSLTDIKDEVNSEKYSKFNITIPSTLVDGYYQVNLSLKDKAGNIYNQPSFYLALNYSFSSFPNIGTLDTKIIEEKQIPAETQAEKEQIKQNGYTVKVKVVDTNKKPVEGAKVTIHSKVQEATTDNNGIAQFNNVEPGEHKIVIAYNNQEGEQSVNLNGGIKEFDLTLQIQPKNMTSLISLIIILVLIILLLSFFLIKAKRKNQQH